MPISLPFHFADDFLCCAETFLFDIVLLICFYFYCLAFGIRSFKKKKLPRLKSRSLLPMFSSRTSMVSVLTFKCLIHFELTFVYGVTIVALYSIPLICMSVFMAIPYSFDYHSFIIVWNQGVWCFQICSSQDCCGFWRSSVVPDKFCCCSVTQSCLTLCSPMACSMPGFPVLHNLLELAQTHVHWVGDAIQPSHLLSFPSPLTFTLSQH